MSKLTKGVIVLLILCLASVGLACEEEEESGNVIKIGVIGPMQYIQGEHHWYGAQMAYKMDENDLPGAIGAAIYSGWGHFGFHWITPFHNIAGMLTESGGAWFYKRNLSANNLVPENDHERPVARFGPQEVVVTRPAADLVADQLFHQSTVVEQLSDGGPIETVNQPAELLGSHPLCQRRRTSYIGEQKRGIQLRAARQFSGKSFTDIDLRDRQPFIGVD